MEKEGRFFFFFLAFPSQRFDFWRYVHRHAAFLQETGVSIKSFICWSRECDGLGTRGGIYDKLHPIRKVRKTLGRNERRPDDTEPSAFKEQKRASGSFAGAAIEQVPGSVIACRPERFLKAVKDAANNNNKNNKHRWVTF